MSSTPVPNYARSDGCLNIVSYTPKGDAKSDLGDVSQVYYQSVSWLMVALIGPKMYFALKDVNNVGSTWLHKDVANTWNILTHAYPVDYVLAKGHSYTYRVDAEAIALQW